MIQLTLVYWQKTNCSISWQTVEYWKPRKLFASCLLTLCTRCTWTFYRLCLKYASKSKRRNQIWSSKKCNTIKWEGQMRSTIWLANSSLMPSKVAITSQRRFLRLWILYQVWRYHSAPPRFRRSIKLYLPNTALLKVNTCWLKRANTGSVQVYSKSSQTCRP